MTGLSTAAWVAHDLGIATGVGGSLFGRLAMHPAVRHVSDKGERGKIVQDAWKTFNGLQLGALSLMALTWFVGRSMLSGREVDSDARPLVLTKDVLVVGTLATAVGAGLAGRALAAQAPQGAVPLDDSGQNVAAEGSEKAKTLNRICDAFGLANILCGAGVIAVTAVLAMQAGRSNRFSVISRLLP